MKFIIQFLIKLNTILLVNYNNNNNQNNKKWEIQAVKPK